MIYVNARAIIERETTAGPEVVVQTRNRPGEPSVLELPGGQVEPYESLISALRREVHEETGLTVTEVEGMDTRLEVEQGDDLVECIRPFAVYQTLRGPVDSMGVYFRCRVEGNLLARGDGSKDAAWVSAAQIGEWLQSGAKDFSWVDRAGLIYYLNSIGS